MDALHLFAALFRAVQKLERWLIAFLDVIQSTIAKEQDTYTQLREQLAVYPIRPRALGVFQPPVRTSQQRKTNFRGFEKILPTQKHLNILDFKSRERVHMRSLRDS